MLKTKTMDVPTERFWDNYLKAAKRAADEATVWHRAVNPDLTEARLKDFAAGYEDGFAKAVAALRMALGEVTGQ